jgi:hypothetical protein
MASLNLLPFPPGQGCSKVAAKPLGMRKFSGFLPKAATTLERPFPAGTQDKNPHVFGRAALLRRPRIQGRAAALPYQESEDSCHAPSRRLFHWR